MELSSPKNKKFQISNFLSSKFEKKKFIFWELELSSPKLKTLLIFQEGTCIA